MSRPSKVDGLKRGIGTGAPDRYNLGNSSAPPNPNHSLDLPAEKRPETGHIKPARITLNLPPELYRQLTRWADSAAETIDVPRVGVQEALRAMVRVITEGQAKNAEQQVYAAIRDELTR
jgi:hypothetical protein